MDPKEGLKGQMEILKHYDPSLFTGKGTDEATEDQ